MSLKVSLNVLLTEKSVRIKFFINSTQEKGPQSEVHNRYQLRYLHMAC